MAAENDPQESVDAFVVFAESTIEHIRLNYCNCDVDMIWLNSLKRF